MEYLTIPELIRIHERMIEEMGGEPGIIMRGNLEFLSSIMDDRFIIEIDLILLTSKVMSWIIKGHPFVDGNKRTGFEAGDALLRKNALMIVCSPEEGLDLTLAIAKDEMSESEIVQWLKAHTKTYK